MKRLCVFCGSSPGNHPAYVSTAQNLGRAMVSRNIELVYGGASVGLMGELARVVHRERGRVIGVIPKALKDKEVAFTGLEDLRIVDSMHERKALMADLSDGFIALPGGLGTIEEFFEILTWSQLGMHGKPCGLLNVRGYFDPLLEFLHQAVTRSFIEPEHVEMIQMDEDPHKLLLKFDTYHPPVTDKAQWALRLAKNQR